VPTFIEQWVSNPRAVDILKMLEYLVCRVIALLLTFIPES